MTILKHTPLLLLIAITACHVQKSESQASQDEKLATGDNSRNSLDWHGVYRGTLPCADCEGIQTEITLHPDQSYRFTSKYIGENNNITETSGSFQWDKAGGKIILQNMDAPNRYLVGENVLFKLDMNGNRILGNLAQNYMLQKMQEDNTITDKPWKLVVLNGKTITQSENQKAPFFTLNSEGETITGYSGCNSFNGTYNLSEGTQIKFSKMISTMMACMDVPYEHEFLSTFEAANNYTINGDTLFINTSKMATLARFVYAPQ